MLYRLRTLLIVLALGPPLFILGCGDDAVSRPQGETTLSPEASISEQESSMATDWPFEDPENTAVITLTRILDGSHPILYVVHDEDGDWQFLDGGDVSEEDAATVSLKSVTERDSSILSLADLPVGWAAERKTVDQKWERFQR